MKLENYIAIDDTILCKQIKEEVDSGSIIIPDTNEDLKWAEVLIYGNGRHLIGTDKLQPIRVKKGDLIYINPMNAIKVILDDEEYWVTKEDKILLIKREK